MVTVAWITPFPPERGGGGGQVRQAHLLLGLARRASIELICPGPVHDSEVRSSVTRLTEVEAPDIGRRDRHPWRRRAGDLAAMAGSRQPIEVRAFGPYRRALAPALEHLTADVVIVEFAGLAPLLPTPRPGRWLLSLDHLLSRMAAHRAAVAPHRRQQLLFRRDAVVAAAFERKAMEAFDAVMTCTAADATALASPSATLVVPNGVDLGRFQRVPRASEPRIVFTGSLYTTPNIDGARWFCHDVLPRVREQVPDVQVDLVGARPTEEVRALGSLPGVTVHADVADVAPYLEGARVAVVPVRIGSGSRLKALEAMAASRPVVGTTIGMEGLDLEPGRHVLIADDEADFAAATIRLLGDDVLAATLAEAARAAVEQRFGWSSIGAGFADSILAIADPEWVRPR